MMICLVTKAKNMPENVMTLITELELDIDVGAVGYEEAFKALTDEIKCLNLES